MTIKIVDLFAGPGGLGEGFSSLDSGQVFKILVSAEMEQSAHATLRLRSFFRLIRDDARALAGYYRFCNGEAELPYDRDSQKSWEEAGLEARCLTLGVKADNDALDLCLDEHLKHTEPWVLIGGPPCQAYSIVGRARNSGTPSYKPENDHRHFLYKEYLRIIRDRRPPVFVMENVLGILSAKISGGKIFHDILRDLSDPDGVFHEGTGQPGYRIHSLVSDTHYQSGMDPAEIDPRQFVVKSEDYGIPQARHRVILLGIREDINVDFTRLNTSAQVTVASVISDLPKLRSRATKTVDSNDLWAETVRAHLNELAQDADHKKMRRLAASLKKSARQVRKNLTQGQLRLPKKNKRRSLNYAPDWYLDAQLKVWLNHEARSHMSSDLRRYAFAATYARLNNRSPTGHENFSLSGLAPNHKNWKSGKFSDRFRVQRKNAPSTTITSHIAKDGHYFIHPDPSQCRSLTVREAARLQTFPDNYFFQGNKTQQYHQVGNAVPPLLARSIANIVKEILRTTEKP
ncbi:DNA (cytosine-5-)-methyltransferase [Duganella sp. FT109W]|uniref:DNA (cytosine-5-)-methyltransferase n=1 Tax=Duganella margarita TaxID=2692170 RepID=A0ABW9WNU0_9BURK|nr:DNA cytosine methyltransferase [Duganella margarita]MYN42864.1 DNA (cytosine-5-)-methyltransferase [Duganella margarita]